MLAEISYEMCVESDNYSLEAVETVCGSGAGPTGPGVVLARL